MDYAGQGQGDRTVRGKSEAPLSHVEWVSGLVPTVKSRLHGSCRTRNFSKAAISPVKSQAGDPPPLGAQQNAPAILRRAEHFAAHRLGSDCDRYDSRTPVFRTAGGGRLFVETFQCCPDCLPSSAPTSAAPAIGCW